MYIGLALIFIGVALLVVSVVYAFERYKQLYKEKNKKPFVVAEILDLLGMILDLPPTGILFPVFISILIIVGGVALIIIK